VRRTNDQIFQLSLTEIAFMLAFLLLLLLGWMLFHADEHMRQLEQALLQAGDITAERQLLDTARAQLEKKLSEAGAKPEDIISSLVSESKLVQERDALKKRVDDLDKQLSALTEVKNTLETAGKGPGASDVVQKEINDALALKAKLELEQQLKSQAESGKAASAVKADPARPMSSQDVTIEALAGLTLKGQIQEQLREQLNEPYLPGQEAQLAKKLVAASKLEREAGQAAPALATLKKEMLTCAASLPF
jgi:polyhydroxyalkanoate synthesis regulator phasin